MPKYKAFVIMPFREEQIALYEELKEHFKGKYEFNHAGDLDNQHNILKDIVNGIHSSDVIIADLTGLNSNVLYELGLAHAMNKKVIIITQNLDELPFDIKSYRANEYSLLFYKFPKLIVELDKLLNGAIDGSVKYGNPVLDFMPGFYELQGKPEYNKNSKEENVDETQRETETLDENGMLDYIENIKSQSQNMTGEITLMGDELNEMNSHIQNATDEMSRVKTQSGSVDASFARDVCRRLAIPIENCAEKLNGHIEKINIHWSIVENSYLSLLDNKYFHTSENLQKLKEMKASLTNTKTAIKESNSKIEDLIASLRRSMGIERRLNKAISSLAFELTEYLKITETMAASIDRIMSKAEVIINELV